VRPQSANAASANDCHTKHLTFHAAHCSSTFHPSPRSSFDLFEIDINRLQDNSLLYPCEKKCKTVVI
jgi:hypothetical protein